MAVPTASFLEDFEALVAGDLGVDRYRLYRDLREQAPVFYSERLGAWVVSRYDDILPVLRDDDGFGPPLEGPGAAVYGGGFLHWRGREHNKKTGIISRRVRSPRAFTDDLNARLERIVRTVLERLPAGTPVDLREDFGVQIPVILVAELTGIDQPAQLRRWYDEMMAGGTPSIANPDARARERAFEALAELKALLVPIIEERRKNPGEDLVSDLVSATYDGQPLPHDEIVAVVAHLLPAAAETTARALSSGLGRLAHHPDEWADLRGVRDDRTALSSYTAELLRTSPPLQSMTRIAREDRTVAGHAVSAGDRLILIIGSANRDPEHFTSPETFDRARFADHPEREFTARATILPFGAGEHHCPGTRLAEAEIVETMAQLLERVERIEPAGPVPIAGGLFQNAPSAVPVILHDAPR
jgi:cytochrome P450